MKRRAMTAILVASATLMTGCSGGGFGGSFCDSEGGERILRFDFEGSEVRISGLPTASRTVGMGLMPYEYRSDQNVILIGPEEGQRETVDVLANGALRVGQFRTMIPC